MPDQVAGLGEPLRSRSPARGESNGENARSGPSKGKNRTWTDQSNRLGRIVLLGIAAGVFFGGFYFVHELVLFVAIAAILTFFGANLVVLGIVFHAAGRSILQSVQKAKPGITAQDVPNVERQAGPIVVTPPVRPAAGGLGRRT
jgi:hypothetical protein